MAMLPVFDRFTGDCEVETDEATLAALVRVDQLEAAVAAPEAIPCSNEAFDWPNGRRKACESP